LDTEARAFGWPDVQEDEEDGYEESKSELFRYEYFFSSALLCDV
jgi:hypothetical protein